MLQPQRDQKCGKPWAKLVVPSSGSTYQRNSLLQPVARALFAVDAVFGKRLGQPRADQLLHGAVGHRHQVHVAFVLGGHALGEELPQARACFARNGRGGRNPAAFHAAHGISGAAGAAGAAGAIGDRRLPASVMLRIWCL